jgi:hypothetical protein
MEVEECTLARPTEAYSELTKSEQFGKESSFS